VAPTTSLRGVLTWPRPQFGNTATAVIITKQDKVEKYEKLVSGTELLESW